ncbi:MAG: CdaR family protein [Acidobacteriota bacterium]
MRLVPRHPWAMVVALALASLLWYGKALDRRERISEKQVDASVTLVNVPVDLVITSEVPRSLLLRVRGPLSRLRSLEPAQTGVVIDLGGTGEGEHELAVETRNVIVPPGVEVVAVSPSALPLRLERITRRVLPVRAKIAGEPASGLVVGRVDVQPPTALVSGPRLQLEALRGVSTDAVSVDGVEGPVEAVVAVRSPQPLVRILEPLAVRVVVEVVARIEPAGRRRR